MRRQVPESPPTTQSCALSARRTLALHWVEGQHIDLERDVSRVIEVGDRAPARSAPTGRSVVESLQASSTRSRANK